MYFQVNFKCLSGCSTVKIDWEQAQFWPSRKSLEVPMGYIVHLDYFWGFHKNQEPELLTC